MAKKIVLMVLMMLLLTPLAGFAANMQVTSSALPATGGSITPNGLQFFSAAANYTISVKSGWSISSVLIDNAVSPNGTSTSQTVPFNTSKTHTIKVTFTQSQSLYSITTSAGPGGQIQITGGGQTNIASGSSRTIIVSPQTGYRIHSYIIDGGAPVVPTNPNVAASIPFINISANHTVSATFDLIPLVTANAGPDQTIITGSNGFASTTLPGTASSNAGAITCLWNVTNKPTGASTTFGNATNTTTSFNVDRFGTYKVSLTVISGGVTVTSTPATITVMTPSQVASSTCTNCHAGQAQVVDWQTSTHAASPNPAAAGCTSCHMPNGEAHPGQLTSTMGNVCRNCHIDSQGNVANHPVDIGENICISCHNPHSLAATMQGAPHFNAITSGTYPASYMTSKAACTNCHVSGSANKTIRQQWAKSGHADTTGLPWIKYDFKTRSGCVQCHTTTGFIAYSTAKVTTAWGVASDKSKEVLTCVGCHSDVANGIVRRVTPAKPFADDSYVNRDVGPSNICMDCHSGTNNGLSIASADFGSQAFIAPHYLAAGGILHGKGGYNFPGQTYAFYSSNTHRAIGMGNRNGTGTVGPCVGCHMTAAKRHLFKAVSTSTSGTIGKITTNVCSNCHGATLDDTTTINARQASFGNALQVLKQTLVYRNFVYSPTYPYFSSTNWGTGQNGANTMGAAFNYALLLKEPGAYAHNSAYAKQLIFDSIDYLYNGAITGSIESALTGLVGAGAIDPGQADNLLAYKAINGCTSCHANTSGSHPAHLTSGFGCVDCHSATAATNTTLVPGTTTHVNGVADLQAGPARSFSYSAGTCSNISCHNNGTATWGTTLGCNGCHGNPPAYANGSPKVNSHANHSFSCNTCHAGTTADGVTISNKSLHVNGVFDVTPGTGITFSYSYAATGGTCSNISCHGNTSATWGSTLGCTTCHGNPPPNAAGNYAGVNEATSPHMKHAGTGANYSFTCNECHKGNSHGTGTYQDVFIDKSGIIAGSAATYTAGTRTCSTLYCHGNGTSVATGQPATGSVVWGSNKLACDGCHGTPPAYANNTPKTNSHANHGFGCGTCHAGTTADGVTISDKSLHVNGVYNVTPGTGTTFSYSYAATGGTCSNISCHGNTSATWGSTLGCTTCHGNPPPNAAGNYAGVNEATSPHMKHAGTGANYSFTCNECHKGNSHGTGTYQDVFIDKSGIIAGSAATYTAGTRTCSTLYCHGNGTSVATGQPATGSVVWGSNKLACDGCHGTPPAYANNTPKTNSHANHGFGCGTCHAGTTADGVTISDKSLHVNGVYNVTPGTGTTFSYSYAATGGTCSNISCHGNTSATWGSTLGCTTCHGNPPPNAAGNYAGVNEATSPHMKHAGTGANYSFTCNECHKGNSHGTGTYQDVFIDKSGIIAGSAATYTAGTRTCSTLYCHGNGTSVATGQPATGSVVWGSNKLACDGCHGTPPAYANNTPKTNSHANHGFGCGTCHAGTTADGVTISDKSLHVNGVYNVTPGTGTTFSYSYATTGGTCSNISCHFNGTATWGTTLGCNSCHGNPPSYANGSPKANSHANHSFGCGTCHTATTTDGVTITNQSLHGNGVYNVNPGTGITFTYTFAATGGTCSNISCHGNTSAVWGSTLGCTTCHGNPPPNAAFGYTGVDEATSPHMKHAGTGANYSFACNECHKGNSHGTGTYQDVFIDKSGIIAGTSAAYTAGTRTCSTLYCHGNGTSLATGQPASGSVVWGSNKLACDGCHGTPPAYANKSPKANNHASHSFGCNTCHAGTTADGVTISNKSLHVNGVYNVTPGTGITFTYTYAATGGTCSNISCHDNTGATWGSNVSHNATLGSGDILVFINENLDHPAGFTTQKDCTSCHYENLVTQHNGKCSLCHGGANPPANAVIGNWNRTCQQAACHPTIHANMGPDHNGVYDGSSASCDRCHNTDVDFPGPADRCTNCHNPAAIAARVGI